MPTYDQFYGRIVATTGAATDTYAELEIPMPVPVATTSKATTLLVPVLKQVDFCWNSLSGISADCFVCAALATGGASLYTDIIAFGHPDCVAYWSFANALTTSGEVIIQLEKNIVFPGDGTICTAQQLTLQQHNVSTGVSTWLACRIWYDYLEMSESTYLRALHNMGI